MPEGIFCGILLKSSLCVSIKEIVMKFSVYGKSVEGCHRCCLLYTSDAADEEDSVDLGGRHIIEKKKRRNRKEKRKEKNKKTDTETDKRKYSQKQQETNNWYRQH